MNGLMLDSWLYDDDNTHAELYPVNTVNNQQTLQSCRVAPASLPEEAHTHHLDGIAATGES